MYVGLFVSINEQRIEYASKCISIAIGQAKACASINSIHPEKLKNTYVTGFEKSRLPCTIINI